MRIELGPTMLVHVYRLNKPLLVVIFIFAMPLGGWYLAEAIHAWSGMNGPQVDGIVLKREEYRRFGGIPAGRVTIKIENTETVVTAEVNRAALERFGKRVRFHYTGDPTREVFLDGEENPLGSLGVAVFFLGCPFVLLVLYVKLKGKPDFEHVIG